MAGSALLVALALLARFVALPAGLFYGLLAASAIAAAAQAAALRSRPKEMPPTGEVLLVALVPGLVGYAIAGPAFAIAGLGQVANRTYVRALVFLVTQGVLARLLVGGPAGWVAVFALPVLVALEAGWTAWLETN
jgi:hypothetical protein